MIIGTNTKHNSCGTAKYSNGFTIIEVSILFVIFLIVAFLVAPLSLNDNMQAKNVLRWKNVQSDFANIIYSTNVQQEENKMSFNDAFNAIMKEQIKNPIEPYKITYLDGSFPSGKYRFLEYYQTYRNSIVSYKLYEKPQDGVNGILLYDLNGSKGPNVWGKDIFGLNIYQDRFEPFCKNDSVQIQKQDCSKSGTGLCCSNLNLIGGNLN